MRSLMKIAMILTAAAGLYLAMPIVLGVLGAVVVLWLLLNSESAFWGGILGD